MRGLAAQTMAAARTIDAAACRGRRTCGTNIEVLMGRFLLSLILCLSKSSEDVTCRSRRVEIMASQRDLRSVQRLLFAIFVVIAAGVHAQWLKYSAPETPRTRDGKPNLSAPVPRAADGKPDLSGVWMHELTSAAEIRRLYGPSIDERIKVDVPGMEIGTQHKYAFNILLDAPEETLMRPEARELMRRRVAERDPADVCNGVIGIPRADLLSEPIKIVQAPRLTVIFYEAGNLHRQIYTDGRTLPKEFEFPAFLGYSVAHWDRDTFVVESAGFNGKTPLDGQEHPTSDALRLTERYRRRDFGHMDIEMTFDDPKMYTKPFTITVPHDLLPDGDIFESFCENEKDRAHLTRK